MLSLIALTFAIKSSIATISCNGIELTYAGGVVSAVPAGVCFGSGLINPTSSMFVCDGSTLKTNTYTDSEDCTGNPISFPISCDTFGNEIDAIASCNIVCDAEPCDIIEVASYSDVEDCEDEDFPGQDESLVTSSGFMVDYCMKFGDISSKYTCDNDQPTALIYSDNNCTEISITLNLESTCNGDTGIAEEYSCGTALAISDLPTQAPIVSPEAEVLECNGLEFGDESGVKNYLPTGVCYGGTGNEGEGMYSSGIANCNDDGDVIISVYETADCSGDQLWELDMCGIGVYESCASVCDKESCPVIMNTHYPSATSCDELGDDTVSAAYIQGLCQEGTIATCNEDGGTITYTTYEDIGCTGDEIESSDIETSECKEIDGLVTTFECKTTV